ncbi:MAG TPA: ribose-phosphate diphosphokinase, partial [Acidisarcina sp.]
MADSTTEMPLPVISREANGRNAAATSVATGTVHVQPDGAGTKKQEKPAGERKRAGRLSEDKRFKLFSGSANRPLAVEICKHIGVPLGETKIQRFADGEVYFQLLENVRGVDVFIVQPTCFPVDQHLVELLIMIDALKRASAGRITVVVPYYGYARQDRKDRPRVAISSKLIADLLTTAGANRALFMDLHAAQIQGFFN